jgi:hypothetical protein
MKIDKNQSDVHICTKNFQIVYRLTIDLTNLILNLKNDGKYTLGK